MLKYFMRCISLTWASTQLITTCHRYAITHYTALFYRLIVLPQLIGNCQKLSLTYPGCSCWRTFPDGLLPLRTLSDKPWFHDDASILDVEVADLYNIQHFSTVISWHWFMMNIWFFEFNILSCDILTNFGSDFSNCKDNFDFLKFWLPNMDCSYVSIIVIMHIIFVLFILVLMHKISPTLVVTANTTQLSLH